MSVPPATPVGVPTETATHRTDPDGGSGPTSSPLLFFVALGFGVVFTNLWIIVGVKYCFRYNARQRARANGDEEPVDLQALPHPRRRRREKKLMSLEEANLRFPVMKYKTWQATRHSQGLPTAGGIKTEPSSRAGSIRHVGHVGAISVDTTADIAIARNTPLPVSPVEKEIGTSSAEDKGTAPITTANDRDRAIEDPNSMAQKRMSDVSEISRAKSPDHSDEAPIIPSQSSPEDGKHDTDNESDEEEEEHPPVDPSLLKESGDTCAICLDTLEDDEDIRGLTCGHVFHSVCLDPWLTTRRACCPLCKKDYYTPKPRPEGEVEQGSRSSRTRRGEGSGSGRSRTGASGRTNGASGSGRGRDRQNGEGLVRGMFGGGGRRRERETTQQEGSSWVHLLPELGIPRRATLRRERAQAQDLEAQTRGR